MHRTLKLGSNRTPQSDARIGLPQYPDYLFGRAYCLFIDDVLSLIDENHLIKSGLARGAPTKTILANK